MNFKNVKLKEEKERKKLRGGRRHPSLVHLNFLNNYRETDRQTDRYRYTETQTQTQTDRHRHRQRGRDRETERDRDIHTGRER